MTLHEAHLFRKVSTSRRRRNIRRRVELPAKCGETLAKALVSLVTSPLAQVGYFELRQKSAQLAREDFVYRNV